MSSPLGDFEQLLLLAVLQRGGEDSGAAIRAEIRERTGRRVSPGAVYTTMARLEERGFVSSSLREPSPEGGRRQKFYSLTSAGEAALAESYRQFLRMSDGLAVLLRHLGGSSGKSG